MKLMFAVITLFSLGTFASAQADVRFIVGKGQSYNGERTLNVNFNQTSGGSCEELGYIYTECEEGYFLATPCPDNALFYLECCPEEYNSTREDCLVKQKTPSNYSCGGYYACYGEDSDL